MPITVSGGSINGYVIPPGGPWRITRSLKFGSLEEFAQCIDPAQRDAFLNAARAAIAEPAPKPSEPAPELTAGTPTFSQALDKAEPAST